MKNIFIKIFIIFISLVIFACNTYATQENTTQENTISEQEVVEEEPTETAKNETMYVQERCNIRSSYSVESERVGGLDVGTEVTVVAEYSNGWYKIKYDGGEAYIKSGILRTTKPEIPENTEEQINNQIQPEQTVQEQQPEQVQTNQTVVEETTAENTDEIPIEDAELINEIGVLPEVGRNLAEYLSFGVLICAVGIVVYIKFK